MLPYTGLKIERVPLNAAYHLNIDHWISAVIGSGTIPTSCSTEHLPNNAHFSWHWALRPSSFHTHSWIERTDFKPVKHIQFLTL